MNLAVSTAHPAAGARVVPIPPPLYYAAAFAAGLALRSTGTALSFGTGAATRAGGAGIVAAGVGLAVAGVVQVRRARTTIVPHRPVSALLTNGVYRISRNPMYTGLAIVYSGGSVLAGSWWPLLTGPLALLAVRLLVIRPEERYLTTRFGPTYLDYLARTPRWIGPAAVRGAHHAEQQTTTTS